MNRLSRSWIRFETKRPDVGSTESKMPSRSDSKPSCIGLLAGWGQYPLIVARQLKQQGHAVVCCGIRGHADPALEAICDDFRWVGLTRFAGQVRFFRRHGVTDATMAGKIFKTNLFRKYGWLIHLPDLLFWRYFYKHFITKSRNRNDDSLLGNVVQLFADHGIRFGPATDYAPELLVKNKTLTKNTLTDYQWRDVQFGWMLAKEMGRLDVGQTVAVKGRAVIAVEAVEGTDECIARAGMLCTSGGFTVVKVAKPEQDMRFDVPTIGVGTLETISKAGGKVLAIEAEKTIILEEDKVIDFANRNGMVVAAFSDSQMNQTLRKSA